MKKLTKVTAQSAVPSKARAITSNKSKTLTVKRAAAKRSVKSPISKKQHLIDRLKSPKGISMPELIKQSGWQAHSVRGFISGTVKKQLHYDVVTELNSSGERIYRIVGGA